MSVPPAAHFLLPVWHILLLTVNNLLFACTLRLVTWNRQSKTVDVLFAKNEYFTQQ